MATGNKARFGNYVQLSAAALALAFGASEFQAAETHPAAPGKDVFQVSIHVDAARSKGEMTPIWRFFGYDEPNYTYSQEGVRLLGELAKLGTHPVYIRTHHLLTSGDGSPALKWGSTGIYSEDARGESVYNFAIIDRIFDTYRHLGLRPFVELGFMPEALSTHPQDYPQNPASNQTIWPGAGFSYPPKDYVKWSALCEQLARHCLERYGAAEVEQWWWEVWNEPNINYWKGTPQEYHKLYDFAVAGVRRAIPTARVGGPHTAGGPGGRFLRDFLLHCLHGTNYVTGRKGSPLDFVAFHAKGSPRFTNGHVRMGISAQLKNIDDGMAVVAAFPELRDKPVILGESDPEGCAACRGPQLNYRNGTMYSSYTAASFARKYELAERHGVNLQGAVTWAFTFPGQPLFAGYRQLASGGLDLPVLNVFRMFGQMSGRRLAVKSSAEIGLESIIARGVRDAPDVGALASMNDEKLCILAWHYHDDDVLGPEAMVTLSVDGLPWSSHAAILSHYRVDAAHSNAYEAWKRIGSPDSPTPAQRTALEQSGQLALLGPPETIRIINGRMQLKFTLPRQAVSLLIVKPSQ